MMRISNPAPVLVLVAGTLSACNSASGVYPQGPWGVAQERREYPRYLGPWGGRIPESYEQRSTAGSSEVLVPARPRQDGVWSGRYAVRGEAPLPYDPPLPQEGPMASSSPAAEPEPVAIGEASPPPLVSPSSSPSDASPPGVFQKPRRASSYAGQWKAVDAKGASCKIQLASVPVLDLYKASTTGCSDEGLRSVNAWSLREDHVILFSRGNAIARLSGEEASLSGTLSASGGSLKMVR